MEEETIKTQIASIFNDYTQCILKSIIRDRPLPDYDPYVEQILALMPPKVDNTYKFCDKCLVEVEGDKCHKCGNPHLFLDKRM